MVKFTNSRDVLRLYALQILSYHGCIAANAPTRDEARVELTLNLEYDFVMANYARDAEFDFAVKHYVMYIGNKMRPPQSHASAVEMPFVM